MGTGTTSGARRVDPSRRLHQEAGLNHLSAVVNEGVQHSSNAAGIRPGSMPIADEESSGVTSATRRRKAAVKMKLVAKTQAQ